MNISNFIWNFFQEIINHSDNNPTKFSVLSYAYFQMLYNFGTLFEKNGVQCKCQSHLHSRDKNSSSFSSVQSLDRVTPLKNRKEIKASIAASPKATRCDLLGTYLYIGHNAFLAKLYKDATQLTALDYGVKLMPIPAQFLNNLIQYSQSHLSGKTLELERAGFATKNTTGLPADYTGTNFTPTPNPKWEQLIVPTGTVKGTNNLPLIVPTNPTSFKIQNFLGINFYKNAGFAVTPTKNIINLASKISTTWENGLKTQTDLLLDVYKDLDDRKKIIAEFFAGSSKKALPPPGFFMIIAMQLSQKYKQSTLNDLKMYFSLAGGLYDACVSAWYYKSTYNQARPINLIRNYYANQTLTSWTPLQTTNPAPIPGKQWLPYQNFDFVTPPFPDVASGHTTFSTVAAKLLNWWFKNPALYDGFTVVTIPNNIALCPSLNVNDKTVCIGEFIFDQGSSTIEPGVTPKERTVLQYKTLQDLADMAGLSRVYGGIHTFQTNNVSAELGDWVYKQTHQKLTNQFKFKSPY